MRTRVFLLVVLLLAGCQYERTPQEQAIDLYAEAGITVTVKIDGRGFFCGDRVWAYYDREIDRIKVCDPDHPELVAVLVHEVAHHLDSTYLTDADRARLLESWGLENWYGGPRWLEMGAEWFAESVTLSLVPDASVKVLAEGGLEALLASMP